MVDNSNNAPPSSLSPTWATAWVFLRQILLILGGVPLFVKYVPPETQDYLLKNGPQIITSVGTACTAVAGAGAMIFGLYRSFRGPTLSSAAALPGAVVLLDSQKEADAHPTNPSIVGPKDPIPMPAPDPKA